MKCQDRQGELNPAEEARQRAPGSRLEAPGCFAGGDAGWTVWKRAPRLWVTHGVMRCCPKANRIRSRYAP